MYHNYEDFSQYACTCTFTCYFNIDHPALTTQITQPVDVMTLNPGKDACM